jgi:hypothetical protein
VISGEKNLWNGESAEILRARVLRGFHERSIREVW